MAVRIPKAFAKALDLGSGATVEITLEDGAIVLRPDPDRTWDLEALLAGVTGENIPAKAETEEGT